VYAHALFLAVEEGNAAAVAYLNRVLILEHRREA
jgi:hypothetical protein